MLNSRVQTQKRGPVCTIFRAPGDHRGTRRRISPKSAPPIGGDLTEPVCPPVGGSSWLFPDGNRCRLVRRACRQVWCMCVHPRVPPGPAWPQREVKHTSTDSAELHRWAEEGRWQLGWSGCDRSKINRRDNHSQIHMNTTIKKKTFSVFEILLRKC